MITIGREQIGKLACLVVSFTLCTLIVITPTISTAGPLEKIIKMGAEKGVTKVIGKVGAHFVPVLDTVVAAKDGIDVGTFAWKNRGQIKSTMGDVGSATGRALTNAKQKLNTLRHK